MELQGSLSKLPSAPDRRSREHLELHIGPLEAGQCAHKADIKRRRLDSGCNRALALNQG